MSEISKEDHLAFIIFNEYINHEWLCGSVRPRPGKGGK